MMPVLQIWNMGPAPKSARSRKRSKAWRYGEVQLMIVCNVNEYSGVDWLVDWLGDEILSCDRDNNSLDVSIR